MLEHRLTLFLVAATFILLWIGGTVNPTGSSLACAEPTLICNGKLFPAMTGGVLYEHGHRLFATSVGILQIIVTLLLWWRRPSLRALGVAALVLVCFQGALGAVTVAFKLPWVVSTLHLFAAFSYLALLMLLASRTRPDRRLPARGSPGRLPQARAWIIVATVFVLAQILLGGLVRHHEAALASLSLPLHDGALWPVGAPFAVQLQVAHRILGVIVGVVVFLAATAVYRSAAQNPRVRLLCVAAVLLVATQIALGVWVILSFRSTPVAVAHFATASLLWAVWIGLALMVRPRSATLGHLPGSGEDHS